MAEDSYGQAKEIQSGLTSSGDTNTEKIKVWIIFLKSVNNFLFCVNFYSNCCLLLWISTIRMNISVIIHFSFILVILNFINYLSFDYSFLEKDIFLRNLFSLFVIYYPGSILD